MCPTLEALRGGTLHAIQLDNLEGLITFPSFHTAAALMFIWALRTVPYVRWPAIVLNVALIAATPIDGAHYFIDLVGGAAVAFAALAAKPLAVQARACRSALCDYRSCHDRPIWLSLPGLDITRPNAIYRSDPLLTGCRGLPLPDARSAAGGGSTSSP